MIIMHSTTRPQMQRPYRTRQQRNDGNRRGLLSAAVKEEQDDFWTNFLLICGLLFSIYLFISCPYLRENDDGSSVTFKVDMDDGIIQTQTDEQKSKSRNPQQQPEPEPQANDISTNSQGQIHEKREAHVTRNDDGDGISCKDENGEPVSWYILYKLPQIPSSSDNLTREGSKYFYLVPGNLSWTGSGNAINSNKSMLSATLQAFWKNATKKDLSYVIYNDQPPSIPAIVMNGHTKGLVLTSPHGGIWLQHSCPHFPDISAQNFTSSYPPGGLINGQMFMCMTFGNTSVIDGVGRILQYTRPFVYNHSIPTSMDEVFPELKKIAEKNITVRKAPWFNTFELETTGTGNDKLGVKVFAKAPKFRQEVYAAWIAPEYGVSLDVQSWLNGAHPFPSNCTSEDYRVYNVLEKVVGGQNFSFTDDHSKWAVGRDEGKPLVCIGDLNRMKPQKTRGGVTICLENPGIWSAFRKIVEETQACNSTVKLHRRRNDTKHFYRLRKY